MTQQTFDAITANYTEYSKGSIMELCDIIKDAHFEYVEKCETADEYIEYLEERIREQEVIYYSTAMEYLSENDNSLNQAMQLASEMGYEVCNLNSELLATLVLQDNLMSDLYELRDEIEEAFELDECEE